MEVCTRCIVEGRVAIVKCVLCFSVMYCSVSLLRFADFFHCSGSLSASNNHLTKTDEESALNRILQRTAK